MQSKYSFETVSVTETSVHVQDRVKDLEEQVKDLAERVAGLEMERGGKKKKKGRATVNTGERQWKEVSLVDVPRERLSHNALLASKGNEVGYEVGDRVEITSDTKQWTWGSKPGLYVGKKGVIVRTTRCYVWIWLDCMEEMKKQNASVEKLAANNS